ncbi:MAG: hypothetical protein LPK19_06845, partial [Hymenobacteraceae bacterium]|nr:hypothetical protein [Hymenobacteraceae bacterium]MDX5395919.1 hypothetical protein [Hymenobacteraceae bacterium]MDX5511977.1 hypothetical protein [Hymenobacteraceae bacterium]
MLRKHLFLFFLLLFFSFGSFAQQKQAAWWFFGDSAGVNFNTTPPQVILNSQAPTGVGAGTVSDAKGNLLFYTNGDKVWNWQHQVIWSNPAPARAANIIIMPVPGKKSQYYVFWQKQFVQYLVYIIVDMQLNSGMGGVISSSQTPQLVSNDHVWAGPGILLHQNGTDFWIVVDKQGTDSLFSYPVTTNGIGNPIGNKLSTVLSPTQNYIAQFKASPNSRKLAILRYGNSFNDSKTYILDFNRTTGVITLENEITRPNNFVGMTAFESLSFSPDNKLLYITAPFFKNIFLSGVTIYQLEIANLTSVKLLSTNDSIGFIPSNNTYFNTFSDIQLGIDGKLYIAVQYHTYLSIINCPNVIGVNCGLADSAVNLMGRQAGPALPVYNQTYFRNANLLQAQAQQDTICLGQSTELSAYGAGATSFRWLSNSSLSSDTVANPLATPQQTTTYTVIGTGSCGQQDTAQVTVVVMPPVTASAGADTALLPISSGPVQLGGAVDTTVTYSWSPGKHLNDSTVANPLFSPFLPICDSVFTFVMRAEQRGSGCVVTDTVRVLRYGRTMAMVTDKQLKLCSADSVTLSAAIVSGTGVQYNWSPRTGVRGVSFPIEHEVKLSLTNNGVVPDTVYYTLTTSSAACTYKDSTQVIVYPRTTGSIAGPASICPNQQGAVYRLQNSRSGANYFWGAVGGQVLFSAGDSAVVDWAATNNQAAVWVTMKYSCDTLWLPVVIGPQVALPIPTGADTTCSGTINSYSTYAVPGAVYLWQVHGGQIISGQGSGSIRVYWQQTGRVQVEQTSYTRTDTCFMASAPLAVHVLPSPDPSLSISGPD